MDYREHPVAAPLRPIVATIWTLEAAPNGQDSDAQPVLPDGRSEIIVHFGDAFERIDAGASTTQAPILVAGQLETPLVLRPTGRTAILGIRLRSAGAAALWRVPQHELVGRTGEARDVSQPLAAWLTEVRDTARSLEAAAAMVGRGLERLMAPGRLDPRVARAAALIDRHACQISVERIAGAVALTRRQLERLFRDQVGLAPKRLMSIRRLHRALQALEHADEARPGAIAAVAGGYADQAHFVRDCRALTGTTPGQHLLHRAELTGLFLDRARPQG